MAGTPQQVKLIRWMMFGVALSLLPLVAAYIGGAAFGKTPRLPAFLARGELLLVTATLAGAAVGELFGGIRRQRSRLEVFVGGVAVFVALLAALSFALITTATSLGSSPSEGFVAVYSTILFVLGTASGAGCVALSGG